METFNKKAVRFCCVALVVNLLGSCVSADIVSSPGETGGKKAIHLSRTDAAAIGSKIWQNECGGTVSGLTSWNAGEDFPSLGIGHFIWYVAGRRGRSRRTSDKSLAENGRAGVPRNPISRRG